LLALVFVALLVLSSPMWGRFGSSTEVARWSSTNAVYGLKHPISLRIYRNVATVDVFSQYATYKLVITDGDYQYVRDFDVPSADWKSYLNGCTVTWEPKHVELCTPDDERLIIPGKIILERIGPD
jgi:hypothetical protein